MYKTWKTRSETICIADDMNMYVESVKQSIF